MLLHLILLSFIEVDLMGDTNSLAASSNACTLTFIGVKGSLFIFFTGAGETSRNFGEDSS
jgi:hypothetical protein